MLVNTFIYAAFELIIRFLFTMLTFISVCITAIVVAENEFGIQGVQLLCVLSEDRDVISKNKEKYHEALRIKYFIKTWKQI